MEMHIRYLLQIYCLLLVWKNRNETHLLYAFSLQSRRDGAGVGQQGDLSGQEIALGCLDCDDRPEGKTYVLSVARRGEDDRLRY